MKKIIEGAKYDTDTAKEIGSDSFSNSGDFSYWSETLYRTKSGKYFLHGTGGGLSKYSQSTGNNNYTGGSRIEPMDRPSAMEWAEKHLSTSEYEVVFGEVSEGEEKEQLNILIPAQLKAKLWETAEQQGRSVSSLVESMLNKVGEKSSIHIHAGIKCEILYDGDQRDKEFMDTLEFQYIYDDWNIYLTDGKYYAISRYGKPSSEAHCSLPHA